MHKNDIAELKALCIAYDRKVGSWPESKWEGLSVFEYVLDGIGKSEDIRESDWTKLIENTNEPDA